MSRKIKFRAPKGFCEFSLERKPHALVYMSTCAPMCDNDHWKTWVHRKRIWIKAEILPPLMDARIIYVDSRTMQVPVSQALNLDMSDRIVKA